MDTAMTDETVREILAKAFNPYRGQQISDGQSKASGKWALACAESAIEALTAAGYTITRTDAPDALREAQQIRWRIEAIERAMANDDWTPQAKLNAIRDIAHAALASPKGEAWRPIETAPKDGTEILLCRPSDYDACVGKFTDLDEFLTKHERETVDYDDDALYSKDWWCYDQTGLVRLEDDVPPTHWMPLPSPPNGDET